MVLGTDEICIKGDKYRIVNSGDGSVVDTTGSELLLEQQKETERLQTLEGKVDKIIDLMGSGTTGGGYRSVTLTLQPREQKYEVMLGLRATQLHIRADQGLLLTMNSKSGEDIFVEIAEFPFSLSELKKNEAIHTLYFTTYTNVTNIRVLAIGSVG